MRSVFISILILMLSLMASGEPLLFKIIPGDKQTEVRFTSDAPMEKVVGRTHTSTGFIELNPSAPSEGVRSEIHVDLASLDTGLKLRNRHMRENHLETDQYPEAVFMLTEVRVPDEQLTVGRRQQAIVRGEFTLHGITREIEPEVYLTYENSGGNSSLRIEAKFSVMLEDYRIKRPQFLLLKLSEEQVIEVDVVARDEG